MPLGLANDFMDPPSSIRAYSEIETFDDFARVVDPSLYRALPDDWQVGVSDVVNSRDAIAAGRYRAVNMAGAAAISALTNAFAGKAFPFVFAGDARVSSCRPTMPRSRATPWRRPRAGPEVDLISSFGSG